MNETELERLIVRLLGDSRGYREMNEEAIRSARATAGAVEREAMRVEAFGQATSRFFGAVTQSLAALGVVATGKQAFSAFAEAEAVSTKLDDTLKSLGGSANISRQRIESFAQAMEKQTVAEDDAVVSMVQQALQMGALGDQSLLAVKNALALADGNDRAAQSFLRMTTMMAQGQEVPALMLRRISPELLNIKDAAERAAKAQEMMTKRFEGAKAMMDTSAGSLTVLKRDWNEFKEELGEFVAKGVQPVVKELTRVVEWMRSTTDETKKLIVQVGAATAAFLLLGPAVRLTGFVLSPFVALVKMLWSALALLNPILVIKIGLWVTWKSVLLAGVIVMALVTSTMILFKAVFVAFNLVLGAAASGVVALAATLVVLGSGFIAAAGIVSGLVGGVGTLIDSFPVLANAAGGPINHLKGLFNQWWEILKLVAHTAKHDIPLAFQIGAAGGALAVEQMKALWPPLWEFIKKGFDALWTAVRDSATAHAEVTQEIMIAKTQRALNKFLLNKAGQPLTDALTAQIDALEASIDSKTTTIGIKLKRKLEEAAANFAVPLAPGVQKAQEQIDKLTARAAKGEWFREIAKKFFPEEDIFKNLAKAIGKFMPKKHEVKIIPKFDAAEWDSAEARSRIDQFADLISNATKEGGRASSRFDAAEAGGAEAGWRMDQGAEIVGFLRDIRDDQRRDMRKSGIEVEVVGMVT